MARSHQEIAASLKKALTRKKTFRNPSLPEGWRMDEKGHPVKNEQGSDEDLEDRTRKFGGSSYLSKDGNIKPVPK